MDEEQEIPEQNTPEPPSVPQALPPIPQQAIDGIAQCLNTIRQFEEYYHVKLVAQDTTSEIKFRVIPDSLKIEAPWINMNRNAPTFPWESMPELDFTAARYDDSLELFHK